MWVVSALTRGSRHAGWYRDCRPSYKRRAVALRLGFGWRSSNVDGMLVARHPTSWLRRFETVVLLLSLAAMVLGALIPSSVMGWLRTEVPGFAQAWDWLDASLPWLNPLHIIVYAWVALLWRLMFPRRSLWRVPLALLVVGVACEWLQQFVPTREPRWTDVLSDAIGIAIGWGVAIVFNRMRRG